MNRQSNSNAPRKYVISKLINVKVERKTAGQYVHRTKARAAVCKRHSEFTEMHGCYVFGIKTQTGIKPVYVGRTGKKTLRFEAFTSHKRAALAEALAYYPNAKLVVAFVVPEGMEEDKDIKEMESVLIRSAHQKNTNEKNPRLRNERIPRVPQNEKNGIAYNWYIDGVTNGGQGLRSKNVKAFRELVGIK